MVSDFVDKKYYSVGNGTITVPLCDFLSKYGTQKGDYSKYMEMSAKLTKGMDDRSEAFSANNYLFTPLPVSVHIFQYRNNPTIHLYNL